MLKHFIFKTSSIAILLTFFSAHPSQSQNAQKEVFKKYVTRDTVGDNKEAHLVFYTNKTFENYGIFNNVKEREWYIWYTAGEWINVNGKMLCKSYDPMPNADKLIKEIKDSYRRRTDHLLISQYYEFVAVSYKDYFFLLQDGKAIDESKKMEYFETK